MDTQFALCIEIYNLM